MYQALYRKWRPKGFDSVCGQEHITSVLKYEIINNRYSHAYLFCGSRGTGKTTCAKLLAKAVNCLNPVNGSPCGECEACVAIEDERTADVVEMDAASNTGVDYIRDIREAVMYAPSMLKNRVYIIDEVHMLTQSAFNALLKTLEEPPSRVVFILATTEQQKIPATILSRCQKFEFRRISADVISDRLMYISEQEGITTEPAAAKTIAKMAQGGMRDAISLLELCAGDGKQITLDAVKAVTGAVGREQAAQVAFAVKSSDTDALFDIVSTIVSSAKEMTVFWQELTDFWRDMLIFKTARSPEKYLDLTKEEQQTIKELADAFTTATLLRQCTLLEDAYTAMLRQGASKRLVAEMTFLKMCDGKIDTAPEGLVARISALEEKLALLAGSTPISAATSTPSSAPATPKTLHSTDTISYKKAVAAAPGEPLTQPQKSENKPVRQGLKPISWWAEATKRVAEKSPAISPFMRLSRAYENGDRLLVRVDGAIARDMLDTQEMRNSLTAMSASFSATPYSPDKIDFVETGDTPTALTPMDELTDI